MIQSTLVRGLRGIVAALAVFSFASASHAAGKVHIVEMLNKSSTNSKERMVFEPSIIKVEVGDTVRFVSKDRGHNSASIKGMLPTGAAKWKSRLGRDFEIKFDKDGTYGYMCSPHYGLGMVGVVLVGDYRQNLDQAAKKGHRGKAKKRFKQIFAKINEMKASEQPALTN